MWDFLRDHTRPVRHLVAYRIYRWPLEPNFDPDTVISFSAAGEDCVALGWLRNAGVELNKIRYLDVGASDPVALSNTMTMYIRGAKGVLVEPDVVMAEKLRSRRPRDIVVNAAVAFDERRTATLIRLHPSVFNTFSEAQAERVVTASVGWSASLSIVGRVDVKLIPINEIIEQHLDGVAPHFLSIDAESVDFAILQSLDFTRFRPWIICIEKSHSIAEFDRFLGSKGYRRMCETPHNGMFMLDPLPKSSS
ncbi:MAG: FkbM family methyltransferase [Hyphomicrobiales bacterium]|nr:FkbM family methyltransferase [Hyphomicrobiales bacterium]MBV8826272.1 FkbM family methyltransferase [Hyphomicrobiales bacterium]MBV9429711.1 FkbM family methyltransferase [Bradyrhizobiaceae bacterium]